MKSAQRLALALGVLFLARPAAATIGYHISLKNPEQHLFHVSVEIPAQPADREIIIALPAWNALYQVRDFSYRVRDVRARNSSDTAAASLPVRMLDKQTWKISLAGIDGSAGNGANADAHSRAATLDYSIEWDDPGPFNSQLNAHHAFVNFAEVLMYLPDRRGEATVVELDDIPAGWRGAAQLAAPPDGHAFQAQSYDKLVDAPAEIGNFEEFGFDQNGAHFRVVVDGKDYRRDRLENYLKHITEYETKLM